MKLSAFYRVSISLANGEQKIGFNVADRLSIGRNYALMFIHIIVRPIKSMHSALGNVG